MALSNLTTYLLNGFVLVIPILIFNILFARKLPREFSPEHFDEGIPPALLIGENILRGLVMFLPLLMPLRFESTGQKMGLLLYVAGTLIYFLSWILLMRFPQLVSNWFAFAAPAYTPLLWLIGIGLIGNRLFFSIPYQPWIYFGGSVLFITFHVWHVTLAYKKVTPQA